MNQPEPVPAPPRESALAFPFDAPPEPGGVREVAEGVWWLRMPLPFRLNHINLWLLRDGGGWTIVDTGIRGQDTMAHWERVFAEVLEGRPVRRVVVTHMHPDHAGQAGWLARRFDVDLWMTRTEFLNCHVLAGYRPSDVPEDALRFYRRAGFTQHQLDLYRQRFGRFGAMIEPLPAGFRRLRDGDRLDIDGAGWEVVVGRGHSPEHACLFSAERGLLVSGDQVLPRISSNVSVYPLEPEADPLSEWLESCRDLHRRLPPDPLVLPAHNEPFYGLHARLEALVREHVEALANLHEACAAPRRAVDVFPALFGREVGEESLLLATGESQAHLNFLLARGALRREIGPDGAARYTRAGAFDAAALEAEFLP